MRNTPTSTSGVMAIMAVKHKGGFVEEGRKICGWMMQIDLDLPVEFKGYSLFNPWLRILYGIYQ